MNSMSSNRFQGAEWKDYSDFEFRWLEGVLTRGALTREDLLDLLRRFDIEFDVNGWEDMTDPSEMGNVLLNDVPKESLLSAVSEILRKRYPFAMTLEEAETFYRFLMTLDRQILKKVTIALSTNEPLSTMIQDPAKQGRLADAQLATSILEELYKQRR